MNIISLDTRSSKILEVLWLFSRNRGPFVAPCCVTRNRPIKDLSNYQSHQAYLAPPLWSFAICEHSSILSGCTPLPAMTHCHFQNIKDDVYCFIGETLQVSRLWVTNSPIELSWTSNKKNIKNVILSFSCGMFFLRWMSGIVILFAF